MKRTIVDVETYYDKEYTLSKMTTEAYVRDPRFHIHCVGVVSSDGTRASFSGDNSEIREFLEPFMDGMVIAHHAQFDALVLSHWLNLRPKAWGCTLSMARAVHQNMKTHSLSALAKHYGLPEKTIDYNRFKGVRDLDLDTMNMLMDGCLHDCKLTAAIALKLLPVTPKQELQIIDQTVRLFSEPVLCLDVPQVQAELTRIKLRKAQALAALGVDRKELQSSAKFAKLLEAQGVIVPMKYSEKQKKDIPALSKTDEGMKELLEHDDEAVVALAEARLGEKSTLLETRCQRLIGMACRGPLPVYLKYYGAHTGRWSGGDKVNFQNFPRGSEIRKSIKAPPGHKLVGVDASQQECRLLNWMAGQTDILDAFRTGRDLYCENATAFFGRPVTKEDKDERQFGKIMELSSGFGCGAAKFETISRVQAKKKITEAEARRAIDIYRSRHPQVVKLWKRFDQVIQWMMSPTAVNPYQVGCVTVDGMKIILPGGTALDYTGMRWDGRDYKIGDSKIYGGLMTENVIQALGAVLVKDAILRIKKKFGYKLALTTHDDILYVVPLTATDALDNVVAEMKLSPAWCPDLPLGAEGFQSDRYDK